MPRVQPGPAGDPHRARPPDFAASTAARSTLRRLAAAARRDRGAASIWLLAVGLVVVAVGLIGAGAGAAAVARHRARVAADLGALAGAPEAVLGPDHACARAAEVTRANGGRLAACRLEGLDLVVVVEVGVAVLPGIARVATATARAGPLRTPAAGSGPLAGGAGPLAGGAGPLAGGAGPLAAGLGPLRVALVC